MGPGVDAPAPGGGSGGLAQKCAQFVQSLLSIPRDLPERSRSWASDSDDDTGSGCGAVRLARFWNELADQPLGVGVRGDSGDTPPTSIATRVI